MPEYDVLGSITFNVWARVEANSKEDAEALEKQLKKWL